MVRAGGPIFNPVNTRYKSWSSVRSGNSYLEAFTQALNKFLLDVLESFFFFMKSNSLPFSVQNDFQMLTFFFFLISH